MPTLVATGAGCFQAFKSPLPYQFAFELAEAGKEGEEQPALWRCRIEPWLFQGFDFGADFVYATYDAEKVFDRSAKPG